MWKFSHLKRHLKFCGITSVNGILADFGVSCQIDSGLRGFSTRLDGPLDMRMNTKSELSAYNVVNLYSERLQIFKNYGELRNARKLAGRIVKERILKPIATTQSLVDLLTPILPKHVFNKIIAQVFQAIRVEVNAELDVIKSFLEQSLNYFIKRPIGLYFLSSLEDRLVKIFIRRQFEGKANQTYMETEIYH